MSTTKATTIKEEKMKISRHIGREREGESEESEESVQNASISC